MAIINTGLLTKGARSEFFARFNPADQVSLWRDLVTVIRSMTDSEIYKWLGTVPRMREWGTGRKAVGLRSESYSVENIKYEATIEVDRDEIADDKTGQIVLRIKELAQHAATHKDYLLAQLLINGATAGFNSYDGVTFFNTAHASGASGNQSNALTSTAVSTSAPTTAEFKTALAAGIAAMLALKDDRGEPMGVTQSGLIITVPPGMFFTALEAVNASVIAQTTNVMQGVAKVVSFPWLTTGTDFFLHKTDGVIRPFILQDREPIEFNSLEGESEEGFKREKYLYGVRARYAMTYGYWQFCQRTRFTAPA